MINGIKKKTRREGGERLRSFQQDIVPLEEAREEDVIGQSLGDKEEKGKHDQLNLWANPFPQSVGSSSTPGEP